MVFVGTLPLLVAQPPVASASGALRDGVTLTATAPVAAGLGSEYSAPSLAVDRDNPLAVYAAAVELRSRRCVFFTSTDGGRRWSKAKASPSLPSFPFCSHTRQFTPMTVLASGRDNTIYFAHQGWSHRDEADKRTASVFVSRTSDGGKSWSVATVHDARRAAPAEAAVNYPTDLVVDTTSSRRDIVYVSWTATYPRSAPARPEQPLLAVSVDAGGSFSRPINATGSFFTTPDNITGDVPLAFKRKEHFGGDAPDLALDRRGNLFVAWVRTSAVVAPAPPHPRYLSRSSDRGRTFTVRELTPPSHFAGPGPVLDWSAKGGDAGSLQVVYEDKLHPEQGDRDIIHRRSVDGGTTWSGPVVLNDDEPTLLFTQVMPKLSVSDHGRVDAAWWDQRAAGGRYAVDVYSASSTDGGASWSANRRVTTRPVDRSTGSWVDNHGDTRQAPAVASAPELAHLAWEGGAEAGGGRTGQGLDAASIQFAPVAVGGGAGRQGVAAMTGLVGGVVWTAVARRWSDRRRRRAAALA